MRTEIEKEFGPAGLINFKGYRDIAQQFLELKMEPENVRKFFIT